MTYYAKRTALAFNYAINTPVAKRARTVASSYVKKKLSSTAKNVLSRGYKSLRSIKSCNPSEVRTIVRNTIADSADKRAITNNISTVVVRNFNAKLIGDDIVQGDNVTNRSGESIHLNKLSLKYCVTHTGAPVSAPSTTRKTGLPGISTWHLFYVQVSRTDNPESFWLNSINDDGDRDFRYPAGGTTPQQTASDDLLRLNLGLNNDDIKVLAYKPVSVSGATGGDLNTTFESGVFEHDFRSPSLLKFNLTAAQSTTGPPWGSVDLSKRIYLVYYQLQPDTQVDDTISRSSFNALFTTHFTDN